MTAALPVVNLDLREVRAYVETRTEGTGELEQVLVITDSATSVELTGGPSGMSEAARLGAQRVASAAWSYAGIEPHLGDRSPRRKKGSDDAQ